MVHRLSRLRDREDGMVAIITVLVTAMVFVGLCALVVDLGIARDTRRQAQNGADASALAAGNVLYLTGSANIPNAISAAKSYAATNYGVAAGDWVGCNDGSALTFHPDTACISFDSATAPMTVRVNVPVRQVRTPFAGIWGVNSVPVGAAAQIQLSPGGLASCGLCVVGSGVHDLQNGSITINGASVAVNGTMNGGPNGVITVNGSGFGISLQGPLPSSGRYTPAPMVNQAPIADPLASLAMPDYSALQPKTRSCTQGPGIYVSLEPCPGGMRPGLYVLTGVTGGNFGIVANGVTLDLVCSTSGVPRACNPAGEVGGSLSFSGNGYLNITGPVAGQPNQGLAIVADRNNTATLAFGGNGAANSGTIYAARGTLAYNGNGGVATDSLIDVGDFSFSGNPSAFVSTYTQAANVGIPAANLHLSQ